MIAPCLRDDAPACVRVSCALEPTISTVVATSSLLAMTGDPGYRHVWARLLACSHSIHRNACFATRALLPRSP